MKKEILERYERNESGEVIINISAHKIEDLYDNFDRKSHFLKKDLNQDLVEYIIDSVSEIDRELFLIEFSLEQESTDDAISRVRNSINHFFLYMKELELKKMKEMMRTSIILLFTGLTLAGLSVLVNDSALAKNSIIGGVIAEGLTVAAWVSLWESLATFLIKWMPYRKKISLYQKISDSNVTFSFGNDEEG
ncbi:MAG TPA: hypothetical protein PLM93_01055 [Sulfuricurvum sp.]|nr:MAG: hypothetical protein B7Y30_04955 [Campylobacterales bacterium 16-40-21]OZA03728.1 MAG: hypothetical protein B7X89_03395 [Sulfuricurvum sp. 17-40-25]HQS65757.1 hypothetical protein [Sulfuricurvum sp.]HQT36400.1 hypothetical protein [Sulfuricurvum sp.]